MKIWTKHHNSKAIARLILEAAKRNDRTDRDDDGAVADFTHYKDGKIFFDDKCRPYLTYGSDDDYGHTEVTLDEFLAAIERPKDIKVGEDWTVAQTYVEYMRRTINLTFDHSEILELAEAIKKLKGSEK